jgi:hypothetical protein
MWGMNAPRTLITTILLATGFTAQSHAAIPPSFTFTAARAPHTLLLDPSMRDPAWAAGKVPGDAIWENVTTRTRAGEKTGVYFLYDDRNLYVGFVAEQSAAPIIATQTSDDVGFGTDDFVAFGVDSSGSGSQAYLFEVTPRGVHYQQATENVRFRPKWQSAARIERGEWRAVMIVPLGALRLRGGATQTWRAAFFRNIAARGEHLSWAYDPTMQDLGAGSWPTFGDLRFWPGATGIEIAKTAGLRPKPRLEIYGLSSIGRDRMLYQQADGTFLDQKTRVTGADLSYPITRTINFVGTLNPDFSNVEIDQQTIAPQEFPRQLTEYRPFFAQGAQYVNPNPQGYTNFNEPKNRLFYSPAIGPFDRGAKIEGTYGLQSFGVLSFRGSNEITGDTFDDQAFGYLHALQNRTFEYWVDGVAAHHSVEGSDTSYEAGTLGRNLHSGLMWLFNTGVERNPQLPAPIAHSSYALVDLDKPNYHAVVQYADISSHYNPLDGFTAVNDIRGFAGFVNLNGRTPGVKYWSIFVQGDRLLNHAGAVHQADSNVFFTATFDNGLSVNGLGPSVSDLRIGGSVVPFNLMNVPLGLHDGTPFPIDISANWGSFGGNRLHLYSAQTSRPLGSKYTAGFEYDASYQRSLATGTLDSQFLRRVSVGFNSSASTSMTLSLRSISGRGGFALPGLNVAAAFHARTQSGDLYVNFGSPSAVTTLDRFIVKYVLRLGADAGT